MIVMKYGGTSVEDASSVTRVAELVEQRRDRKPVVVVSAMGKTTRKLLRTAELAAEGDMSASVSHLEELRSYHAEIVRGLQVTEVQSHVEAYFDELKNLLSGLFILRELTLRGRDRVAAYGELISSTIVAAMLKQVGVDAVWLDARQFMITDENHTRARPLSDVATPRIVEHLQPCLQAGQVPVTQGYIGSTLRGATTTLGFEGSDYTAAIIGAALEAEEIQIWKTVDGLMTADPELIPQARTVRTISFVEAKELTHLGAKVLHPRTLFPVHEKNIPVFIHNTTRPDAPGTMITAAAPHSRTPVKSIAYKKPVSLIEVTTDGLQPRIRPFQAIFDALDKVQLFPLLVTTSESSAVVAVAASEWVERLARELQSEAQVTVVSEQAIIGLVGERLSDLPGFAANVLKSIHDIPVRLISQGASAHSLALVVQIGDVEKVLRRLHDLLFYDPDPEIFA